MDVVIGESAAILELLTCEDKTLLVWRDSFFVLDLSLDTFDGVSALYVESDSFSGESFYENLHFSFI